MSDSFFGFEDTVTNDQLEEGISDDDEDYDALNDETFGDDILDNDWEEDHEKLAELAELSKKGGDKPKAQNGDLSSLLASLILDDDFLSPRCSDFAFLSENDVKPKPRPPPGFWGASNGLPESPANPPFVSKICTVDEIERNLIKPSSSGVRLEDLERNLISGGPRGSSPGLSGVGLGAGGAGPPFSSLVQPPARPAQLPIGSHLQKLHSSPAPPLGPPSFPQIPPHHPLLLQPGLVGLGGLGAGGAAPPRLSFLSQLMGTTKGGSVGLGGRSGGPVVLPPPPRLPTPPHPLLPLPGVTGLPGLPGLPGHPGQLSQHSLSPPQDEYAGLMSIREKHWVAGIQLMQLNSTQPFRDDYYFVMYQARQCGGGRKLSSSLKLKDSHPHPNKPTYTPLQFENSLGKIQVVSVTAPRKIIDTEVMSVEAKEKEKEASGWTSAKKAKQLLLEIEQMYTELLRAEELLSPLYVHPAEDPSPPPPPSSLITNVVNKLAKHNKLNAVLNVRKGRVLVLRVLSHIELSGPVAAELIGLLPQAARRDSDQSFLRALPAIRHYLASATLANIVQLGSQLEPHLAYLLEVKLGVSVLANMIERAENLLAADPEDDELTSTWLLFLSQLIASSKGVSVERPVVGVAGPTLSRHLARVPAANNQQVAALLKALSNSNSSTNSTNSTTTSRQTRTYHSNSYHPNTLAPLVPPT